MSDFKILPYGHGTWIIFYCSAKGKTFTNTTTHAPLIDAIKFADSPKLKDLTQLMKICKTK